MREILLASDFSARSDRALDRAAALAGELGARLAIVHVLARGDADDADLAARLRADLPPGAVEAELVLRRGSVPKTLAAVAAERGSDLIVTGVARYNGIGDYLLGTAVDHIVRNAGVPVLVVRRRTYRPYRHLLVATDFSDCARSALLVAGRLFPEALITLVHALHLPYEGRFGSEELSGEMQVAAHEGMQRFLAHPEIAPLGERIDIVIEEGTVEHVVLGRLASVGADLLVLGANGYSGFVHATIGSHAEALLAAADTDVLMVRFPGGAAA